MLWLSIYDFMEDVHTVQFGHMYLKLVKNAEMGSLHNNEENMIFYPFRFTFYCNS